MPGRRRNGGERPGGSLGAQIKEEISSALKLLFKDVAQKAIDPSLTAHWTAFETAIPCDVFAAPLPERSPRVSEDPIAVLARLERKTHTLPALDAMAASNRVACSFEPALAHEPALDAVSLAIRQADLGVDVSAALTATNIWPVEPVLTADLSIDTAIPAQLESRASEMAMALPEARQLPTRLKEIQTRHQPRYYGLPIKKAPVPPHRFAEAIRETFKRKLAEKAGTHPANVQLKIIFERMNMALYQGLQQDEQGYLLCTPKREFLGRNPVEGAIHAESNAYLVFGIRLDTKEDIRALVPVTEVAP